VFSAETFESLESRLALYQNPMIAGAPPIASLENANDTVVRIDTNLGKFDIELFDSLAPVTVANFKNYVTSGRFDESFFHQLSAGSFLAGGRYKFADGSGLSTITPSAAIPDGFSRSNLAQTLAMIPDTSTTTTDRFLINLQDNISFNTLSGGYTVFAKVVQGWSVVQAIAALSTRDLDQALTGTNSTPGTFDNVPVTGAFNPTTGPTEATIVKIVNIEITKGPGTNRYFEQSYVMAAGSRSSTTIERLDLVNVDSNFPNSYQIIVRYENGDRDSVISTGTLAIGARTSLKVNDLSFPNYNLVRTGQSYSFEVVSTRAMGVSLNHRDTGVTEGEAFLMETRLIETQLRAWNFADGAKSATDTSTLSFESLTDQNISIYMLIFPEGGAAPTFTAIPLKAFRRGTVVLNSLAGLADGHFSVQISATGPIVAALTHTKTGGGTTDGDLSLGVTGAGRVEGYLAAGIVPTGGESHVDFFYSAGSPAIIIVDVEVILNDGTILTPAPVTLSSAGAGRKYRMDLSTIPNIPADQYFSVHYSSRNGATAVTASFEAEIAGDSMSTPFMTMTTGRVNFADGYTDPTLTAAQESETISVFNPFNTDVGFKYDVLFHFSDGSTIYASGGPGFSLAARHRSDRQARDFSAVMAKINSNAAFRFYSVEVISTVFTLPIPTTAVVAQLTRLHNTWGQSMTTLPGLWSGSVGASGDGNVVFLDNAQFH
jgi:cyclophilin family peptidyl-prolyl cis-trans isomerase